MRSTRSRIGTLLTSFDFIITVALGASIGRILTAIPHALRRERLTEAELRAAIRKQGYGALEQTVAVVLESDGQLKVIGPAQLGNASALPPHPVSRDDD